MGATMKDIAKRTGLDLQRFLPILMEAMSGKKPHKN